MEEISPYSKNYAELSDEERDIWKLSYEVLTHGDRLYGTSKHDVSHLSWSIGVCLDILRAEKRTHPNVYMLLELGIGEEGYCIRVLSADSEKDDVSQVQESQEPLESH